MIIGKCSSKLPHASVCWIGMAALAMCVTTAPASAQNQAAYVPPKKGLQFVFAYWRDGKEIAERKRVTHTILDIKGDVVINTVGRSVQDHHKTLRGIVSFDFFRPRGGVIRQEIDHDKVRALWPLAAGKRVQFTSKLLFARGKSKEVANAQLKHTDNVKYSLEILRREKVTVPAGTFDTFVIRQIRIMTNLKGKVEQRSDKTYWYAPSLGWIVRLISAISNADEKPRKSEVVLVEIKQAKKLHQ